MTTKRTKRRSPRSLGGFVACALAVSLLSGSHWGFLQTIAWARMVAVYAIDSPILTALQKTFDGQHPCSLCLTIREGRQQEQTESRQLPSMKPDETLQLLCDVRRTIVPPPPATPALVVPFDLSGPSVLREPPPKPPPRLV